MKPQDEFTAIQSVESFYDHLERHALDYTRLDNVGRLCSLILEHNIKTIGEQYKQQVEWEAMVFYWSPEKFLNNPEFTKPDPTLFKYLAQRLDETKNPLLKARYASWLWNGPTKRQQHAITYVDGNLDLVTLYEQMDAEAPEQHHGRSCLDALKEAFETSAAVNYRCDETKAEIRRLLNTFNPKSSFHFALKISLIELHAESKKGFDVEDWKWAEDKCWELTDVADVSNRTFVLRFATAGERLAARVGNSPKRWANRLGELYAKAGEGTDPLNSINWTLQSINAYQRAGNKEKIRQMLLEYEKATGSLILQSHEVEFDGTEVNRNIEETVNRVTALTPERIMEYVSASKDMIPQMYVVRSQMQESKAKTIFHELVSFTSIDSVGNVAAQRVTSEQKDQQMLAEQYKLHLDVWGHQLIVKMLKGAFANDKVTLDWLLSYLRESTWLGDQKKRRFPDGEESAFFWIDLLRPAFDLYFQSIVNAKPSESRLAATVLCADSLAPKVEGMLRHMCRLSGEPTTSYSSRGGLASISEKTLDQLLNEPVVLNLIGDNNAYFLNFVLSNREGHNLRHRISHSLMSPQEYVSLYAHLLIFAVLRLSAPEEIAVVEGADSGRVAKT